MTTLCQWGNRWAKELGDLPKMTRKAHPTWKTPMLQYLAKLLREKEKHFLCLNILQDFSQLLLAVKIITLISKSNIYILPIYCPHPCRPKLVFGTRLTDKIIKYYFDMLGSIWKYECYFKIFFLSSDTYRKKLILRKFQKKLLTRELVCKNMHS